MHSATLEARGVGEDAGAGAGTGAGTRGARRAFVQPKHAIAGQGQASPEPKHNQAQLDCERALGEVMAEEAWQDRAAAGLLPGWGKLPLS